MTSLKKLREEVFIDFEHARGLRQKLEANADALEQRSSGLVALAIQNYDLMQALLDEVMDPDFDLAQKEDFNRLQGRINKITPRLLAKIENL